MYVKDMDVIIGKLSAIEIELHNVVRDISYSEESRDILELAEQVSNVIHEIKKQRALESARSKFNGLQ